MWIGVLSRAAAEIRHRGQHAGEKALHVGGAAAVEAAVALDEREGIAVPGLAVDRHDVGVAGEADAGEYPVGPMVANSDAFSPSVVGTSCEATPCWAR